MKNKYPWIRLYREALHDPKIVTLSDRHFRAWVSLLLIADDASGELPRMRDIAVHLRMSISEAETIVRELVDLELIDWIMGVSGAYVMHGWQERQMPSDSSAERTRKYRERLKEKSSPKRHGDGDVTAQTQTQKERIYNNPSSLDATRSEEVKFEKSYWLGGGDRGVGTEARRTVARVLNIGDPEPVVAAFLRWPRSRGAVDIDAMFIASAEKIFARLKPDARAACQPLDVDPEPLPPVQPSSSLLNSKLVKGPRRG